MAYRIDIHNDETDVSQTFVQEESGTWVSALTGSYASDAQIEALERLIEVA